MTKKKKSISEPADSEQDGKRTLHPEYEKYMKYKENHRFSPRTIEAQRDKFSRFPDPDDLDKSYFEKRLSQKLSTSTIRLELALIRAFLKWSQRNEQLDNLRDFKLEKIEPSVTEDDIYKDDELKVIWQTAESDRDRALLRVLYESAFRAGELLSMTYEGIREGKGGTLLVKCLTSKTRTREVPVSMSVPSLKIWLESHPTKQGSLWVSRRHKAESGYEVLTHIGLDRLVRRTLKRAGVTGKKRIIHMFRHTRITHWYHRLGVRGMSLAKLTGWTSSNMEKVYVHLSLEDAHDTLYKALGIDDSEPEKLPPSFRECPNCHTQNDFLRWYCVSCNKPLTLEAENVREKSDLEEQVATLQQNILRMGQAVVNITNHLAFMPEDELREKMAVTRDITSLFTLVKAQDMLANTPKDELQERIDRVNVELEKQGETKISLAYWEELLAGSPKIELQQILQNPTAIVDMIRRVREKEQEKTPKKQSQKKKPKKKS